jgi:hypothetical protein
VSVVVTTSERGQIQTTSLLKVHGCAERKDTLLLTTAQLTQPPIWAQSEIAAGLAQATVVFLGIGDVASYVKYSLEQIVSALGSADRVRVVSPSIVAGWATSNWSSVLPTLDGNHRWPMGADEFAHGLLAAWVNRALFEIRQMATNIGIASLPAAYTQLENTIRERDADRVLSWFRRSHHRPKPGVSIAWDTALAQALLATALVCSATPIDDVPLQGPARAAGMLIDLLVTGPYTTGLALASEAYRRADRYRHLGIIGPSDDLTVMCAGETGPLIPTSSTSLPASLIDDDDDGIIGGATVYLKSSHKILAEHTP